MAPCTPFWKNSSSQSATLTGVQAKQLRGRRFGVAAVIGVSGCVLYFQESCEEGRVFWRQMPVDADRDPGSVIILTEAPENDGSTVRDVHPEYVDALDGRTHVPNAIPQSLQDQYGADEPYDLVRYDGHDCTGIPGDEGGDAFDVTRTEFNDPQLGECVKR